MTMTDDGPASAGASIAASLELYAGAVSNAVREMRRQREIDRVMQPVHRHFANALIAPASGIVVFWLGGPDAGHKWELRSVIVTGVTRATSEPGAVDIFATAQDLRMSLTGGAVSMANIGTGDERDFIGGSAGGAASTNFSGTGSAVTTTVPAGQSWALSSISFLYTCSAAVANRNVRVRINDSAGRNLYTFVDSTALTASQTGTVSLAPGNPTQHTLATGTNFTIQGNLPPLVLPAGSTIIVDAIGIDAADTMTLGTVNYTLASGALPVSRQYSSMQLAVYAPEDLFLIVSGATATHEIHCNVDVEDIQLGNVPVIEAV